MKVFATSTLGVFVGMLLGAGILLAYLPRSASPPPQPERALPSLLTELVRGPGLADREAVVEVYERVSPAVVNVNFSAVGTDPFGRSRIQEGTGSGFIIDQQGHVVTNHHVVTGARRLDITLADSTSHAGEVVAVDPANDLAVVRISAPTEKLRSLAVAALGDSDALKVGQTVVAIGNPFGLERSASLGIVSALGRVRRGDTQRLITNMIQTDAAINPGNSGGPLVNLAGEVVGINEQIEAPTRGNVGVGFAIPVNTLKRHLPDLVAGHQPQHAWMGIGGQPITPTLAEELRLPVQHGVLLATVVSGGPADRAGLRGAVRGDPRTGDIITELDGQPVRTVEDVATSIDRHKPGDQVRVGFVRGGSTQQVDATLAVWESGEIPAR